MQLVLDLMANESLKNILNHLKDREFFKNLIIRRGIEKEFFRVDKKGFISNSLKILTLADRCGDPPRKTSTQSKQASSTASLRKRTWK